MTITPVTTTLQPWKRTLRTIVAVIIGIAASLPIVFGVIPVAPGTNVAAILSTVLVFAAAVTRFAASPAGNYVFGIIGLDAAQVTKTTADVQTVATDAVVPVPAIVTAVQTPTPANVIDAASAVTTAAPVVIADVQTVASDSL